MELASAPLHKGQVPWRGLLLTGKEAFLGSREQGSSEAGWGSSESGEEPQKGLQASAWSLSGNKSSVRWGWGGVGRDFTVPY